MGAAAVLLKNNGWVKQFTLNMAKVCNCSSKRAPSTNRTSLAATSGSLEITTRLLTGTRSMKRRGTLAWETLKNSINLLVYQSASHQKTRLSFRPQWPRACSKAFLNTSAVYSLQLLAEDKKQIITSLPLLNRTPWCLTRSPRIPGMKMTATPQIQNLFQTSKMSALFSLLLLAKRFFGTKDLSPNLALNFHSAVYRQKSAKITCIIATKSKIRRGSRALKMCTTTVKTI